MADDRADKLLRKSFQEIKQLREALQEAKAASSEPIAIIGLACRGPGGFTDPEGYWSLLDQGRDAIRPLPARLLPDSVYDRDPEAVGKSYVREGGFLDDVERFDAEFFGIAPREAVQMDPQQRVLLETSWEALERAGIEPSTLNGSRTGVYMGAMGGDYGLSDFSLDRLDGYRTTGVLGSVLSGRISYVLGLHGPSMTIDTACSSSLAALHLACSGLRQRECDVALGGGVTVMCTPSLFVEFSRLRASAPDGRSKAFGAQADGAGWAEGCGVLVLKRLTDALRDSDRILAVIRGSAVNQDGRSQGLTAPNGPSQVRLIRRALELSGLAPQDIDAIEAHGTGTSLGDPIEAGALGEVFGPTRSLDSPLWLGSSKSNIGHSQAAAGVLGVIKMVLALEHERLPKTLHAEQPSELVAWETSGLSLLQAARDWPRAEHRVRRAGVSSFGIGGTNAHLILEEARAVDAQTPAQASVAIPLLLSGRTESALREQAVHWANWLHEHPQAAWSDVRSTAALHRTHLAVRASLAVTGRDEALKALKALSEGRPHAQVSSSTARERTGCVFVFPGQGSQWSAMGRELLEQSEVFAAAVEACDTALRPHTGWSVRSVLEGKLSPDVPHSERVDVVQPTLFTMSIGLAAVWRSFGIEPSAVVGHSQGEIAAAVVSGALSLEDGARIVALRSQLLLRLAGTGAMATVELSADAVAQKLKEPRWSKLSIAAVNTATSSVVSGDPESIDEWVKQTSEDGVFCRRIAVDYASHSAHVEPLLGELNDALATLASCDTQVPMISTVTGAPMAGRSLDASYWCENLRQPVRLDRALAHLLSVGCDVFVEVSPHPVLTMALEAACADQSAVIVHSLTRDSGGLLPVYRNLGALHASGVEVSWSRLIGAARGSLAALPTYAFQGQRYWLEPRRALGDLTSVGLSKTHHPLLGAMTPVAGGDQVLFSGRLSLAAQGWLSDHAVFGVVLLPGTGLLELALTAGRLVGAPRVAELTLESPLALPEDGGLQIQLQVQAPDSSGARSFQIYSRVDGSESAWKRHAAGTLTSEELAQVTPFDLTGWPPSKAQAIDLGGMYARLEEQGYEYGPSFQRLTEAWTIGDTVYGRVAAGSEVATHGTDYGVHPAVLDAALHALLVAGLKPQADAVWLPFAWSNVSLHGPGSTDLRVKFIPSSADAEGGQTFVLWVADVSGRPVLSASLQLRRASGAQLRTALGSVNQDLYRLDWHPVALPASSERIATQVIACDHVVGDLLGVQSRKDVADLVASLEAGLDAPSTVILDVTSGALDAGDTTLLPALHAQMERALRDLQTLLAEPRLSGASLVWLIRSGDGVSPLVTAPLWGLLRSARREHPYRVVRCVDVDTASLDAERLWRALAADSEPELRMRADTVSAARLVRASVAHADDLSLDPESTILITGGLGELGQSLARHLVRRYGARHLVLTSRRGAGTPGASEFGEALKAEGAVTLQLMSCNMAERAEVAATLAAIPSAHPLGAVFHLASVLSDGPLTELEPEGLHEVLRPKVDGALHLHELTRSAPLSCFVMFSSVAGVLGTLGQASYAGANTFLDALADERHREGLPALSLAWGLWEQQGIGMSAHLGDADLLRLHRQGVAPFPVATGLSLLDAALGRPEATLVPVKLDLKVLERQLAEGAAPEPLFSVLARAYAKPTESVEPVRLKLHALLSALPEEERTAAVLSVVCEEVAAVLRLAGPSVVNVDQPLRDLGVDSLMSVELRNRLSRHLGSALPTTLAFNHPTPAAIATFLLGKLQASVPATPTVRWDDEAIEAKLRRISIDALKNSGLLDALMAQPDAPRAPAQHGEALDIEAILGADSESLLEVAQRMLAETGP